MKSIIFNKKEFKPYDAHYFVSADGEVFSTYSNKCLKTNIDLNGYPRVDIHQKHMKIHRLVYLTWIGPIDDALQINHKDDNKLNNHWSNLYQGTQKENIKDCHQNNHAVGRTSYLTVYDKQTKKTLTFCPSFNFIEYCGHPAKNKNISRMFTRNWFKKRYKLIDFNLVKNRETLESLTTMDDECNPVGRNLSPVEAHSTESIGEEIV